MASLRTFARKVAADDETWRNNNQTWARANFSFFIYFLFQIKWHFDFFFTEKWGVDIHPIHPPCIRPWILDCERSLFCPRTQRRTQHWVSDRGHASVTSPQRSHAYLLCVLPHGFRHKQRETVCSLDQFYWLYWNNENDQETVGHGVSLRSSRFLFFSRRRSNKRSKKRGSEEARLGCAKN